MTYTSYQADIAGAAPGRRRVAKFFRALLEAHIEARMQAVRRELRSRGIEVEPMAAVRAAPPTSRFGQARSGAERAGAPAPLRSVGRFLAAVGEIYVETLALRREMKRRYPHLDL